MTLTYTMDFGIFNTIEDHYEMDTLVYSRPWNRFFPYGVGAIFAWLYFEFKSQDKFVNLKESFGVKIYRMYQELKILNYISFFAGIGLITFLIFIQYDFFRFKAQTNPWPVGVSMLFNGFARGLFSIGVILILLPTFQERISWLKSFLSSDFMVVAGRLTYAVYLMHLPIIFFYLGDLRYGEWVSFMSTFLLAFAILGASFVFAVPFVLICEIPFMNLQKFLMMPKKKISEKSETLNQALKDEINTENEKIVS